MAKLNRNIKNIDFSSAKVKKFVEDRTSEISDKTGQTKSYILEQTLLKGLLPTNDEIGRIVLEYLYSNGEEETKDEQKRVTIRQSCIKQTLSSFFSYNSMGSNWASRHSNCKELIEYCVNNVVETDFNTLNDNHNPIPYLSDKLDSIITRIDACSKQCIEIDDRTYYSMQLAFAKKLLNIAKTSPKEIDVKNHFELIRDCWSMLDNWSITYRYLMTLSDMAQFRGSPQARNDLFDILFAISEEWGKESAYD